MKFPIKFRKLALAIAIGCALAAAPAALAMEVGQYEPPDLEGFDYIGENYFDNDLDPDGVKETHALFFENQFEQTVIQVTCDGITYGWVVVADPTERDKIELNYMIIDSDGDGLFDQRFHLDETAPFPDHLK